MESYADWAIKTLCNECQLFISQIETVAHGSSFKKKKFNEICSHKVKNYVETEKEIEKQYSSDLKNKYINFEKKQIKFIEWTNCAY